MHRQRLRDNEHPFRRSMGSPLHIWRLLKQIVFDQHG